MMNRGAYAPTGSFPASTSANLTTAAAIAQNYVARIGNPNLAVTHVAEYTQGFYVQVTETNTGAGAFEIVVNKATGAVTAEPGPTMMWNTKYGVMSNGAMGAYTTPSTTAMPLNDTQAETLAQQYLNGYLPGTTLGSVTTFLGYYKMQVQSGATTYGLLSVNGYTGQVWYHTYLGQIVQL